MKIEQSSQLCADVPQSDPSFVRFHKEKDEDNSRGSSCSNNYIIVGIMLVVILASLLFLHIKVLNSNQKACLEKAQAVNIVTNNQETDEKLSMGQSEPPLIQATQKEMNNPSAQLMIEALNKNNQLKNQRIDELNNELQEANNKLKQNQEKLRNIEEQIKRNPQKLALGDIYSESQLSAKHKLQEQRRNFASKNQKQYEGFKMITLNHQLHSKQNVKQSLYFGYEKFIQQHKKDNEAEFCIIIPNYLNLPKYYYEYTFNSIFNQNYTNYKIVIFSSNDYKVNSFIHKYLSINKIQHNKYVFVQTYSEKTSTENVYIGVHHYCQADSLTMIVQGGDQLLGREVFTIYNGIFDNEPAGVVFTNHFQTKHNDFINWGGTSEYKEFQLKQKSYRKNERTKFQLLAFKTELFKAINLTDLKDNSGQFFETVLTSIFFPLSEISCGRVNKKIGVFYVQNIDQRHEIIALRQKMIFKMIQRRQKYECEPMFKKTMDDLARYPKQLNDISKKRVQKGGMISVTKGTVTQIDLLAKNAKGQRIEEVICNNQACKTSRINFHKRRLKFIQKNVTNMVGLQLIKYNLKYDNSMDKQQKIDEQKQYKRLDQIYHFDNYKQELPFCLIVCSLNNNVQSRIQYNLNSIFTQNYTNYFVVIFNDASWDGSDQTYRKYLNFHNISKDKYVYIENKKRKTALENLHIATYDYCSDDSITMLVDGDDELIGRNVIKVFNVAHQKLKGGVIYSNYIDYAVDRRLEAGISKSYTQKQKEQLQFRFSKVKYSHVRTHVTALWKTLDKTVYQDEAGEFYKVTYDFATYTPMMEHACGRVYYIGNFFYLYNGMTGLNDGWVNYGGQIDVVYKVRAKPKLECLPEYKVLTMYDDANLVY